MTRALRRYQAQRPCTHLEQVVAEAGREGFSSKRVPPGGAIIFADYCVPEISRRL